MIEKLMMMALTLTQRKERGATATEYALLVALIAIILTAGVFAFGDALNDFFELLAGVVQGWL